MHPDTLAFHARAPADRRICEARYTGVEQIDPASLERWLGKARAIQRDYMNVVRRKGKLERLV